MNIVSYLSQTLYIAENEVEKFINTAPHRYKQYQIPKRNNNGVRLIAQPAAELKIMQLLAIAQFQQFLPVHSSATAYCRGKGIMDNAKAHAKNSYLLKMDFKDFFHSIKPSDLIRHCSQHMGGIDDATAKQITKLFFWTPKRTSSLILSIGSPASPFISNTVMYQFDCLMSEICSEKGIVYTRYADDITFTTNVKGLLFQIPSLVIDICKKIDYPRLSVNSEKTVFSSKGNNRHVTGVTITNEGKLSLGRHKKRKIKSLVFDCLNNKLDSAERRSLSGLLAHAKHIEPSFFLSLTKKYGYSEIAKIASNKPTLEVVVANPLTICD
ncbi:retron St85 family RNA-directed DNA polymerase [Stutzerimonas azotifigens]|uniref:retron St85 family RNA-directed DNA polymerase n=1 Tax=Stutzerimonas azotifigens TaxID=291995 RepID=UPI000A00D4EB|nr:retron St85 family RNA-directed DNA polymerase [Stutzerimonas azotifigens]